MSISPDVVERAERQARIEEDIRRLFDRYRRRDELERESLRRFRSAVARERPGQDPPERRRA
jgi:hypothetical protein